MTAKRNLEPLHVVVAFGSGIPAEVQGRCLLYFETMLRDHAQSVLGHRPHIEVFKEQKGDDSKLRASMTKEQRSRL
jgi:hypothetical protein